MACTSVGYNAATLISEARCKLSDGDPVGAARDLKMVEELRGRRVTIELPNSGWTVAIRDRSEADYRCGPTNAQGLASCGIPIGSSFTEPVTRHPDGFMGVAASQTVVLTPPGGGQIVKSEVRLSVVVPNTFTLGE